MPISAQPLLSQLSSDWQAIWRCLSQHSHCYHSCHQIGQLFGDAYLSTATAITAVIRLASYLAMRISAQPLLSQLSSDWPAIWRCLSKNRHCYHSCHQIGKLFGDAYLSTATAITAVIRLASYLAMRISAQPLLSQPSLDWQAIWRCLSKNRHCYNSCQRVQEDGHFSIQSIRLASYLVMPI